MPTVVTKTAVSTNTPLITHTPPYNIYCQNENEWELCLLITGDIELWFTPVATDLKDTIVASVWTMILKEHVLDTLRDHQRYTKCDTSTCKLLQMCSQLHLRTWEGSETNWVCVHSLWHSCTEPHCKNGWNVDVSVQTGIRKSLKEICTIGRGEASRKEN